MPSPRFAFSELLIVFIAVWVVKRLFADGNLMAGVGVMLFGLAAAVGVLRFGFNMIDELANFHFHFSQIGGTTAMSLITFQIAINLTLIPDQTAKFIAVLSITATFFISFFNPSLVTPLFLSWLSISVILVLLLPINMLPVRFLRAALMATFMANIVFIRRSPLLGVELSWHLFHAFTAIWLICVWWIISKSYSHLSRSQMDD